MNASDEYVSRLTKHSAILERHKKKVVKDVLRIVESIHGDAASEIARREIQKMSKRELQALIRKLSEVVNDGYKPVIELINKEVVGLGNLEAGWAQSAINASIPSDIRLALPTVRPSPEQLKAAIFSRPFQGYLLKEWFAGMSVGALKRIKNLVRQGYADGLTSAKIIQQIRGYTDKDGIRHKGVVGIGRHRAAAAVQTALAHTANVARSEFYKSNSDIFEYEVYVATLDTRTTMKCRLLDGERFEIGKGPHPPLHINCRSTRAPVLKSWERLGFKGLPSKTRASMNGEVPSDLNYEDWLRQQSAADIDEVMGRAKGRLFRKGTPLKDFADKFGNELTLDQLKQMGI